jgi:hypothetical protein
VIKIDVEGGERAVLDGLRGTLADSCRLVYCEVHAGALADRDVEPGAIDRLLRDRGFTVETVHRVEDRRFVRGVRDGAGTG